MTCRPSTWAAIDGIHGSPDGCAHTSRSLRWATISALITSTTRRRCAMFPVQRYARISNTRFGRAVISRQITTRSSSSLGGSSSSVAEAARFFRGGSRWQTRPRPGSDRQRARLPERLGRARVGCMCGKAKESEAGESGCTGRPWRVIKIHRGKESGEDCVGKEQELAKHPMDITSGEKEARERRTNRCPIRNV